MLHHRTNDPAERADHVAQGEADKYYRRTGDSIGWMNIRLDVSQVVLLEFMGATDKDYPFPTPVNLETRSG
jgi:hypothetical protein